VEPTDLPETSSRLQSLFEGGGSTIALIVVVVLALLFFGYLLIDGYCQRRKWKRLLKQTKRDQVP